MSVLITGTKWDDYYAPIGTKLSIFLVGPSKRPNTSFISYRKKFIELCKTKFTNDDYVIFNPEWDPENGLGDSTTDVNEIFNNSQEWELKAFEDSKVVVIGLDTDQDNLGMTTRTEYGFLVETRRNLVVYAPKSSYKMSYQVNLARIKNIPVYDNLSDVIDEILRISTKIPVVTSGRFNSTEIYACDSSNNLIDSVVLREHIKHQENLNNNGAIWVFIKQLDYLNLKLITQLNYTFHHYNSESQNYVFYKWNNPNVPNMVPEYATSIVGACAMILNKEDTKVLFVYEESYGKKWYKFVSGAVDTNELAIEGMMRELTEELGIKLENTTIKLVGGYNQKSARYNKINDCFYTFVVNIAETTNITPDGVEVLKYQWLNIKDVLSGKVNNINGIKLNGFNVDSLRNYKQNSKYLDCKVDGNMMIF